MDSRKIVQEQVKKVPTTGGDPILVVTKIIVTRYFREDLMAISSIKFSFMTTIEDNF
jgi:hypothetical protein